MINYMVLGVSRNASDEEIREAYLTLVKKHTPEKDPERFRLINGAYEAVKDKRRRISERLSGFPPTSSFEEELVKFARGMEVKRLRVGLGDLFQMEKNRAR